MEKLTNYPFRKVLLLEGVSEVAKQLFENEGYIVEYIKGVLSESELKKKVENVHFIGIRSRTVINEEILSAAKKLQCIGSYCIGTDKVDLQGAMERGIPVFNSPFCNSRSVAELVIHYIIGLSRKLGDKNMEMHKGEWNKTAVNCYEIRGKTLGIIGYGHVGMQVSVLAEAMGMKVIYYDIIDKLPLGNAEKKGFIQKVLSDADFVTLHVPKTKETDNLIDKSKMEAMRTGSYLINASRGSVVDLEALEEVIRSGKIAGAALDVYPEEPVTRKTGLTNLENVILTPHIGGSTIEAQTAIGEQVSNRYINYVNYGSTVGAVNFPEVEQRYKLGTARICNVHRNKPGVLASINELLSEFNITQQTLKTNESVGYMICDISAVESGIDFKEKLQKLENTIRTRIRYHGER